MFTLCNNANTKKRQALSNIAFPDPITEIRGGGRGAALRAAKGEKKNRKRGENKKRDRVRRKITHSSMKFAARENTLMFRKVNLISLIQHCIVK